MRTPSIPLIYSIFEWVGEKTSLLFVTPTPYVVGDAAADVYFGLLKARRENKKLVIMFPFELPWRFRFHLINIRIVDIDSEYRYRLPYLIDLILRLFITIYYAISKFIGMAARFFVNKNLGRSFLFNVPMIGVITYFQPNVRMREFSWEIVNSYDWYKQIHIPLDVNPSRQVMSKAVIWREELGLPPEAWFACIHVRESGFHGDRASERNASIENYFGAIEEVTKRGGWVIRLGDRSMTRLPKMTKVIDYPFTSVKCPEMDMYLISQCGLYIGMTSGIYDLALLFQRPIVLTNVSSWLFGLPPKKTDVCVLKHVFSKKLNRFLSVYEWLHSPWESMSYRNLGEDYMLYENSLDELRDAVSEFFQRDNSWSPSEFQSEFNKIRLTRGYDMISKPVFAGPNAQQKYSEEVENPFFPDYELYDVLERYKLASRLSPIRSYVSYKYLQKNWTVDSRNGNS